MEGQTERDIVARRPPRQKGIVLEQDADLRRGKLCLDRARQRLLQPDYGTQQARFPRAGRPDQANETTIADDEAGSFEDRLAAVGNRQIADAQLSAPRDRSVVQP
jgi:hypothetical protein